MTEDQVDDVDEQRDQLDAADPSIVVGYVIPLGDGVSEARTTGLVAVYDTRALRYVEGAVSSNVTQLVERYGATRTGRYRLRRV